MTKHQFTKGWHAISPSCYAYTVPVGGWGQSNTGFIRSGSHGLLIDTQLTLPQTRLMLDQLEATVPGARIETVVNTHAHGDHIWGNQLVSDAEIISTEVAYGEIVDEAGPSKFIDLLDRARAGDLDDMGRWMLDAFGAYDFREITVVPPNRTFSGELDLKVGDLDVRLIEVGRAHTFGDLIIHVPQEKVLFVGDIIFNGVHPVIWKGSLKDSIRACDLILGFDTDIIVAGHGPICGRANVERFKRYIIQVEGHATRSFESGLSVIEAAVTMPLGEFVDLYDPEKLAVTVGAVYRSLGWEEPISQMEQLRQIAELHGICSQPHFKENRK